MKIEGKGTDLSVKRRPLAETVREQISNIILNGELKPGDKLNEMEIAGRLEVSRGPVREAARQLEEMGLLETHAFRGSYVKKFSQREVADIYSLREILESTAALEAVRLATPSDLNAIEVAMRDTETAALSNSRSRMMESDAAFHTALCRAGKNDRITETFKRLATELRLVHLMMSPNPEQLRAAALDHAAILRALRSRNAQHVVDALRSHITGERDVVLQYLAPHGSNTGSSVSPRGVDGPQETRFTGKIIISRHSAKDYPLLARMNRELADDEGHRNPMTVAQMEERFRHFVNKEGWSVDLFKVGDEIVGYATHRRDNDPTNPNRQCVFLKQFYIVRHYRRDNFGKAAFDALAAARFQEGERVVLEVIENNPGGRVFWMRVGFTPYSSMLEYIHQ
ncbi:GNAT family N-acetyltransferase [Chelativorans multitrophicus]|uniref:Transcriptional regulator, GntR family n=1 Tax=Chelativorans sp. (strain BNC1) TaxID=266779 RepID=Q11KV5_CHESB|nr:GNAT family N-acetyltransferase [Chelativorans multitrophicus]